MLSAALSYARRGWAVIPIDGKLPRTEHGSRDASTDEEAIRAWWRRWPDADVGIATGAVSGGLVVLDVDVKEPKRGDRVLVELVRDRGPIPWSLEVLTGGCGAHHYFVAPAGVTIRNSRERIGPGLDVRGEGGYVVAPPSVHASGSRYSWVENGAALVEVGGWLLEAMTAVDPTPAGPVGPPRGGFYGPDVDERIRRAAAYVDKMPNAVSGSGGHDMTWKVALVLVRGFELPAAVALPMLRAYNARCVPPWSERELAHKIDQAVRSAHVAPGWLGAA